MKTLNPATYSPKASVEFIGPATKIARMIEAKSSDWLATGTPLCILFYGPTGTGKTALSQLIAAKLAAHSSNIESVNGRRFNAETLGRWEYANQFKPIAGGYNVRMIQEIDLLKKPDQDAMLTFLEDLKPWQCFIGSTNADLSELTPRFQGRFQQYKVEAPQPSEIQNFLVSLCGLPDKIAARIAAGSGGSVRVACKDAQSCLDMSAV